VGGGFLIEYLGRGVREHGLGVLAKAPFHLAPALEAEHDWVPVLANFLIDPSQYAYEGTCSHTCTEQGASLDANSMPLANALLVLFLSSDLRYILGVRMNLAPWHRMI
jgi:hypothetical protein